MNNITENVNLNNNTSSTKIRKTLAVTLIAAAIVAASSVPAAASKYRSSSSYSNSSYDSSEYENSTYDYAKVINVAPVVESYQVNKPVEQCWDERVPVRSHYRDRRARSKTKTPEIVGAILGGIIGNQVGKRGGGKARDVATVAGAVLGGSIGRDTKHNSRRHQDRYDDRYETARYETVQRCDIKDSYITQEQVVGYDVEYKYRGNVFHTQMAEHPGKKIKVKVTVNPA